uniref:Uncharacterized protein n=1 Tax=Anguilla anguilla TaxID=7936 RepID=A0A0E9TR91_ANGAN
MISPISLSTLGYMLSGPAALFVFSYVIYLYFLIPLSQYLLRHSEY